MKKLWLDSVHWSENVKCSHYSGKIIHATLEQLSHLGAKDSYILHLWVLELPELSHHLHLYHVQSVPIRGESWKKAMIHVKMNEKFGRNTFGLGIHKTVVSEARVCLYLASDSSNCTLHHLQECQAMYIWTSHSEQCLQTEYRKGSTRVYKERDFRTLKFKQ